MPFFRSTRGGVRLTLSQPYPFSIRVHGALLYRLTTLCLTTVPAGALFFSAPAAQAKDKLVGVWAWTTGNPHTFVRGKPDFSSPPVGKLPLRTPVLLWGKYGAWYRVETADHVFGWMDAQYVVSRDLSLVQTLSKWKADEASDRVAGYSPSAAAARTAPEAVAQVGRRYEVGGESWHDGSQGHIRLAENPMGGDAHPAPAASDVTAAAKGFAEAVDAAANAPLTPAPVTVAPTAIAPALGASTVSPAPLPATTPGPVPAVTGVAPAVAPSGSAPGLPQAVNPGTAGPSVPNVAPGVPAMVSVAPPVHAHVLAPAPIVVHAAEHAVPHIVHVAAWHKWTPTPAVHWTPVATHPVPKWESRHAWRPAYNSYWVNWRAYKREQLRREMGIAPQPIVPVSVPPVTIAPVSPAELLRARDAYLSSHRAKSDVSTDNSAGSSAPASGTTVSAPAGPAPATPTAATGPSAGPAAAGSNAPGVASASTTGPAVSGTADEAAPTRTSSVAVAPQPVSDPAQNPPSQNSAATPLAPAAETLATAPLGGPMVVAVSQIQPCAAASPSAYRPSLAYRGGSPRDRAIYRGGSPRDLARARFGQGLANQAVSYRGMPYIRGADSPDRGFDCSGLVYFLLRRQGFNPPRTAAGYASFGTAVPRGAWKPGDLVLFANTYKRGISHIGVYMGNGKFVHAAMPGAGVRVDSLFSGYYSTKYYGARRIP